MKNYLDLLGKIVKIDMLDIKQTYEGIYIGNRVIIKGKEVEGDFAICRKRGTNNLPNLMKLDIFGKYEIAPTKTTTELSDYLRKSYQVYLGTTPKEDGIGKI